MQTITLMLLHLTEVYTIFKYKIICAVNLYSHMKYLHRGEVIRCPYGSVNTYCVWLQPTFSSWQSTFATQSRRGDDPQQQTTAPIWMRRASGTALHRGGICGHFGSIGELSRGRWLRVCAAAARLAPSSSPTSPPSNTEQMGCVWQRIYAEKTGSLTYSCLLCLH